MAQKTKARPEKQPAPKRERPGEYVGFRSPTNLKEKLERAAKAASRSLSSEAQFRLERSFDRENLLTDALDLAYGPRTAALVLMIAEAMDATGSYSGFAKIGTLEGSRNWTDDPYSYDQVVQSIITILEAFRPEGTPESPHKRDQVGEDMTALFANMGRGFANGILEEVARGAARTSGSIERVEQICRLMGTLRDRIAHLAVGGQTTTAEAWGKQVKDTK